MDLSTAPTAGVEIVDAGIPLVVRTLIKRYGGRAASAAANRARVLEDCGDRVTSGYWDAVRRDIEAYERAAPDGRREFSDPDSGAIAAARQAAFGDGTVRSGADPYSERDDDASGDEDQTEPPSE